MEGAGVFSQCGIFEPAVNAYCDRLFDRVRDVFGEINRKIILCGSVARILDDDPAYAKHSPKDIDFVICSAAVYRYLTHNIQDIFLEEKVAYLEQRIIIYTHEVTIELWFNPYELNQHTARLFKEKIYYTVEQRLKNT